MFKIERNWGKIANYPPNAQQRLAPLSAGMAVGYAMPQFLLKSTVSHFYEGTVLRYAV